MKYLIILLFMVALPAHADWKDSLRGPVEQIFGKEKADLWLGAEEEVADRAFLMPEIPKVKENAMDTGVYKAKKGGIYDQGEKFQKLSNEEKRKFRISFLQELFLVTRNADATKDDIVNFLNVLEQGGSREGVYRKIVLDEVYASLERYEEVPEKKLVDFTLYFGGKYMARGFQKESIMKLNLWMIKRVITEQALELVDVLALKPDDLHKWYAIFSEDMAKTYPQIWNNKLRKNQNLLAHYSWVKKVPFQQIKSELIIKLHKVMNHLNKTN